MTAGVLGEAVLCVPLRTAIGRFGGAFRDVPAATLAAAVIEAVLERSGMPPDAVDDVILGHGYPSGEAPAIGRVAALDAGLDVTVAGSQVDRRCGSGLDAVLTACMQVQTGVSDVVLAGGVESMSQVEHYLRGARWGGAPLSMDDRLDRSRVTAGGRRYPIEGGMIETAENLRREFGISRQEQDELALGSHERALAAIVSGAFGEEIVPVAVPQAKGAAVLVDRDEGPRADTTLARLGALRPMRIATDPDATVTAGNASGQNDGAALVVVATPEAAERFGLWPVARLLSWASAGVDPTRMGLGPIPATARALDRAGLGLADIDLIELNEAFAAQVLACGRAWELADADWDRINVNGSGISLGHPIGATGARLVVTLLGELGRRGGGRGLVTMCIGGGQGLAAVFESTAR